MEFFLRASGLPSKLAILSGAFHPPTRAHLALAQAALARAGEVLFVLPRVFPHKAYSGASFEQRRAWLEAAVAGEPRFSIATTDRGLFAGIAAECRAAYGGAVKLYFICGRDAAERIIGWDYGDAPGILHQLESYELLVAAREGDYQPPVEMAAKVHPLSIPAGLRAISSTEVRRRIAAGEPWEHLVPAPVAALLR
ncbi:MAG: nicotinate-nicotinamide nucleotide adenylyltransferase [Bryobacteraceae bacterium]